MTFYLKYRPQNLSDLDSEAVRNTLTNIVSSGNLSHAFLFSGPKGTGKTSAARILAKIVNCQKKPSGKDVVYACNHCEQCESINEGNNIDVIEIDAASNRGIEDIRIIRDAVKLAPVAAIKKIYIIDEAHMLTTEASNALLKTLEEPPKHVIFILATTNPEKLIPTIRSRVVEVNFSKAEIPAVISSLKKIVKAEKLSIQADSLELIAQMAKGSFRDAAKLLEQAVIQKAYSRTDIEKQLKSAGFGTQELILLIFSHKITEALTVLEEMDKTGWPINDLLTELLSAVHLALLSKNGIGTDSWPEIDTADLLRLYKRLITAEKQLPYSPIEVLPLELALISWSGSKTKNTVNDNFDKKSNQEPEKTKPETGGIKMAAEEKVISKAEETNLSEEAWQKILITIKPINTSIEALLKAAKPLAFDGTTLKLGVYYKFHKERLEENRYRMILEKVVSDVLNCQAKISCLLTQQPVKISKPQEVVLTQEVGSDIVNAARNIFGS